MAASVAGGPCRAWGGCHGRWARALLWRGLSSGTRRPSAERETHFGFQTVSEAEKGQKGEGSFAQARLEGVQG